MLSFGSFLLAGLKVRRSFSVGFFSSEPLHPEGLMQQRVSVLDVSNV